MAKSGDPNDPKGLIYESFRIDGHHGLGVSHDLFGLGAVMPVGVRRRRPGRGVVAKYARSTADHPMKQTLQDALKARGQPSGAVVAPLGWRINAAVSRPRLPVR